MKNNDKIIITVKNVNEHSKLIRFIKDNNIRHENGDMIEAWLELIDYKNLKLTGAISGDKKKLSIQFNIYNDYVGFWWPNYNENGINIFEFIEKYKERYGT